MCTSHNPSVFTTPFFATIMRMSAFFFLRYIFFKICFSFLAEGHGRKVENRAERSRRSLLFYLFSRVEVARSLHFIVAVDDRLVAGRAHHLHHAGVILVSDCCCTSQNDFSLMSLGLRCSCIRRSRHWQQWSWLLMVQ